MRFNKVKYLSFLLIFMMLLSFSFATPISTLDNPIELISPDISPKGEVFIDKSLYISVRILSDIPVVMSLTKIESNIIGYEAIEPVFIPAVTLTTTHIAQLTRYQEYINSLKITQNMSDEEMLKAKKQTIEVFALINQDYLTKKRVYDELYMDVKKKYGANIFSVADEKLNSDPVYVLMLKASDEFKMIETKQKLIKPLYDKLFERLIIDSKPVILEGVLPYFNYELKDIKSGKYRLNFFLQDNLSKGIKTFNFEVKSRQDTVKEILNSIQDEIDELWKIKP